ncbi:65edb3fb-c379-489a-9eac-a4c3862a4fa9 [Thermothielavioides terrestris]|uniref:65edb3fb-c379-489a-9eac-a4c3862a4fa9 n=1 Tax=Thermothielavioides terrestris TaxID=2587410 RepID=A0A3S4AUQ4_9PEZI|nr:65edb3fb-c379-489a-9eac-a4c3862a4fa9 [Thermothielavioides terrestris]
MDKLPPKYVSSATTWRSKLALRTASALFLIIIAAIGGSLANTPRVDVLGIMLILAPGLIAPFIWDIAEGICILCRGGHRGIHPGAIVAIDLLCWLGWVVIVFFMCVSGLITRARYFIDDYSGYDDYQYDMSKVTPEDAQLEQSIEAKGRVMAAFGCLTVVVHFMLFVIGCRETNIRNRTPQTVYVMQPIYSTEAVGPYQLGQFAGQSQPPMPQMPVFLQPPPSQLAARPSPAQQG